jgi:hypothetical protein
MNTLLTIVIAMFRFAVAFVLWSIGGAMCYLLGVTMAYQTKPSHELKLYLIGITVTTFFPLIFAGVWVVRRYLR